MADSKQTNQTAGQAEADRRFGQPHHGHPADDQFTAGTVEPEDMERPDARVDDRGQLIETFLSPRDFATLEQCQALIAGKPAGYHVVVGRIAGYATGVDLRESGLKVKAGEKVPPPMFWAKGQFESVALATGEIKTAPWLILPRSAAELVGQAFVSGAERILLDLEIGLQSTGKAIPYRWTVRAYGTASGEAQRLVAAIRSRQEARANAREPARIENQPGLPMEPIKSKTAA
jgi:hypothetical protein